MNKLISKRTIVLLLMIVFVGLFPSCGCEDNRDHRDSMETTKNHDAECIKDMYFIDNNNNSKYSYCIDSDAIVSPDVLQEIGVPEYEYTAYILYLDAGYYSGQEKVLLARNGTSTSRYPKAICATKMKNEEKAKLFPDTGVCEIRNYCIYGLGNCVCKDPKSSSTMLHTIDQTKRQYCNVSPNGDKFVSSFEVCFGRITEEGVCKNPDYTGQPVITSTNQWQPLIVPADYPPDPWRSLNRSESVDLSKYKELSLTKEEAQETYNKGSLKITNETGNIYVKRSLKPIEFLGSKRGKLLSYCDTENNQEILTDNRGKIFCLDKEYLNTEKTALIDNEKFSEYKDKFIAESKSFVSLDDTLLKDQLGNDYYRVCQKDEILNGYNRCLCYNSQEESNGMNFCKEPAPDGMIEKGMSLTRAVTTEEIYIDYGEKLNFQPTDSRGCNPGENCSSIYSADGRTNGYSEGFTQDASFSYQNVVDSNIKRSLRANEDGLSRRTETQIIHKKYLKIDTIDSCGDANGYITYTRTFVTDANGKEVQESSNRDALITECEVTEETVDETIDCQTLSVGDSPYTLTSEYEVKALDDNSYGKVDYKYSIIDKVTVVEVLENSVQVCKK